MGDKKLNIFVEYIGPLIVLVIIAILKIAIDEEVGVEKVKRIIVEEAIDIMSLSISLIISYLISVELIRDSFTEAKDNAAALSNNLAMGFIWFAVYILFLVIIVLLTKYFTRKYSESEQNKHLFIGTILGYTPSLFCLINSIVLLNSLGG